MRGHSAGVAAETPSVLTPRDELEAHLMSPARLPARSRRKTGRGQQAVILVATILVVLSVWHLLPTLGLVNPIILPTPLATARGLWMLSSSGLLFRHLVVTLQELVLGYGIGVTIGFSIGTMLAVSPLLRQTCSPYVLAFQSLPKVVLAPLLVAWFGFGLGSKVATAAAIGFFPLLVNTMVGLQLPSRGHLALMYSLRASRWQIFKRLQLPTGMPLILVGLKNSLLLAFTGALVAEILVGSHEGLGYLVHFYNLQINMHLVFAVIAVVALLSTALITCFEWLDRRVVFWGRPEGTGK